MTRGYSHGYTRGLPVLTRTRDQPYSQDNDGWTPLHEAANGGQVGIVELLLSRGADFSVLSDSDRTPLDLAYEQRNPEVAALLFEYMPGSIKGSKSLLVDHAANTTANTIPLSISPPDVPPNIAQDMISDSERYSVYTAAQDGRLDIVRSLLDRGSDVEDRNTLRETALDAASRYGHLAVARLLIERGADVNARDRHGWTPLITASTYGQLEVARLLLDHGADVNARKRDHNTALHYASFKGNSEIVRLLLKRGAQVDVQDYGGRTPIDMALRLGYHSIAELLKSSGSGERGQGITVQVRHIIPSQVTFDPYNVTNYSPSSRANYTTRCR
jgi:ankyrin repeat protein